jgi:hypothetical protein
VLDRIIGGIIAEPLLYIVVWGILLPVSVLLATPVFLVHALLHPTTSIETLAQDYRGLFRWWLGHFPFEGTPRVPADPEDMTSAGRGHDESSPK